MEEKKETENQMLETTAVKERTSESVLVHKRPHNTESISLHVQQPGVTVSHVTIGYVNKLCLHHLV